MTGRLYIVSGKQLRPTAEFLESLIDAGPTPAAGERTELWTVRDYLKNKESVAPEDHIIFVGAADAWLDELNAEDEVRWEKLGMLVFLRRMRAMLTVDAALIGSRKGRRDLIDYLRTVPEISEAEVALVENEKRIALLDAMRATLNPFSVVLEQQLSPPPSSIDLTDTELMQYKALMLLFNRDIFPNWIENMRHDWLKNDRPRS